MKTSNVPKRILQIWASRKKTTLIQESLLIMKNIQNTHGQRAQAGKMFYDIEESLLGVSTHFHWNTRQDVFTVQLINFIIQASSSSSCP
jgi:hypothetical protein